tara:strand:+ start:5022 stop:5387 length:366 start_codon:yes stop_codon:yes gene_type:complete
MTNAPIINSDIEINGRDYEVVSSHVTSQGAEFRIVFCTRQQRRTGSGEFIIQEEMHTRSFASSKRNNPTGSICKRAQQVVDSGERSWTIIGPHMGYSAHRYATHAKAVEAIKGYRHYQKNN